MKLSFEVLLYFIGFYFRLISLDFAQYLFRSDTSRNKNTRFKRYLIISLKKENRLN